MIWPLSLSLALGLFQLSLAAPVDKDIPNPDTSLIPQAQVQVQIAFDQALNYQFVNSNPAAAAQIFQNLPKGIADGLSIDVGQVQVQRLSPLDTTSQLGYITTLAIAFIPSDKLEALQSAIAIPTSPLYQNSNPTVRDLMSHINPSISITSTAVSEARSLDIREPTPVEAAAAAATWWTPAKGASWQIILLGEEGPLDLKVDIYDIDLLNDRSAGVISQLHKNGKKVICYFSAGSSETDRPGYGNFEPGDKGGPLYKDDPDKKCTGEVWEGENWLRTTSTNVRNIMKTRIQIAAERGCDAIDPDNMDAYDNCNGLTPSPTDKDARDYLKFLSDEAHARGMGIGLKNAGDIVDDETLKLVDFSVQEQCAAQENCADFQPFITNNKPVFHIEYPEPWPPVVSKPETWKFLCDDSRESGNPTNGMKDWSTVLKNGDCEKPLMLCDGTTYAMD